MDGYYLNGTVREPWTITTPTGTLRESWVSSTGDKNQGDLRVDLTEPEKAFDWVGIRKILGSI